MQQAAAGRDEDQEVRPQQLREQPAPLELGIVEVLWIAELECQQLTRSGTERNARHIELTGVAAIVEALRPSILGALRHPTSA